MNKRTINILLNEFGKFPVYATEKSAGADLHSSSNGQFMVHPGQRVLIPTGVYLELPDDCEAQIRPRSGLALKHGITVLNSPGTIDADYQGEVGVILINHGDKIFVVEEGDRIAQMVFNGNGGLFQAEFNQIETFTQATERGAGGFGHTGKK